MRLCFKANQAEVVLTLAELASLSTDLQRLQDYARQEQRARRPQQE